MMFAFVLLMQMTTTNCYPVGNTVQCNSYTPPSMSEPVQPDYNALARQQQQTSDGYRALGEAIARRKAERRAEQQRDREVANATAYQRYIGGLIAAGQCRAARTDALQQGKYELVQAVDSYCHPAADEPAH